MEVKLQNNKFWYFLTNTEKSKDSKYPNRIELIFDMMESSEKWNDKGEYSTFRFFNNKFQTKDKTKEEIINDTWKDIKTYFRVLEEWIKIMKCII